MEPSDEVLEVEGQEPTPEDEAWLAYVVKLREQAASAYNEAAKTLITASSLFLAFYGAMASKVIEKTTIPIVVMLIPAVFVLAGVVLSISVIVPFTARVLTINITEIKKFAANVLERKNGLLIGSIVALALGSSVALLMLFLASSYKAP